MRLLLCFLVLIILSSCEGDYIIRYHWEGMTAHNANNLDKYPVDDISDSIAAATYVIKLKMNTVETYRQGRYLDSETPPTNTNSLDSLIITSSENFNASHPAGTNLTAYFNILNGNYFYTLPADGSEGYYITNVYSSDFKNTPNVEEIDLLLMELPEAVSSHVFTVTFILEDSTIFTQSTNLVTLY